METIQNTKFMAFGLELSEVSSFEIVSNFGFRASNLLPLGGPDRRFDSAQDVVSLVLLSLVISTQSDPDMEVSICQN